MRAYHYIDRVIVRFSTILIEKVCFTEVVAVKGMVQTMKQVLKAGGHLTAHLARAADDICATFAAVLAAFEAQETLEGTDEAVFSSSSSTETLSVVLLVVLIVVGRSRVHDAHLNGSLRLVGGGLSGGLHVDVEWKFEGNG